MKSEKTVYRIGQVTEGVITGIKPYGAFVRMPDGQTGLIHISEVRQSYVTDVRHYVKLGEKIVVKILDIDPVSGQLRLSLKAIHPPRRSRKKLKRPTLPHSIGFSSLAAALPEWLEKAQKENKDD